MLNISDISILMFIQEIQDKLNNPPTFEKVLNLPECEREFIKLIKGIPMYQLSTLRDDIRGASDIIVRYNRLLTKSHGWDTNIMLLASLQYVVANYAQNKNLCMKSITAKLDGFNYLANLFLASLASVVNANRVPEKDPHSL